MKQIVIKSKLSEDDVLKKAGIIQKELLDKKLLQAGDEIVADYTVSDDGKEITLVINGDILSKDKYKALKKQLLEIGEVTKNDLKNFDDEDDHDKEKSELEKQKVDVALNLHDSSELLINQESNMSDLKTLLFSDEEIAGSNPAKPADQPSGSQTPDFSKIDANGDGKISKEEWIAAGLKEDDFAKADANGNGEITKDEFEAFFKSASKTHDDQEKPATTEEKPKVEDPKPETHDAKPECPACKKDEVINDLKKLLVKKAKGENLSVAEKFFCDSVSKMFSEDELKEMEHFDEQPKKCYKVLCPKGTTIKEGFESEAAAQKYIEDEKIEGATVAECTTHDAPENKDEKPASEEKPKVEDPKPETHDDKSEDEGEKVNFDSLYFDLGTQENHEEQINFDALYFDVVGDKFDKIDTNKDGKISKEEWLAAGLTEEDFIKVDTNKDGEVSKDEYKAFIASKDETHDDQLKEDPKPEDKPENKDEKPASEEKPKVEDPKPADKPEKPESQIEMIKRLNKVNKAQTLEGRAKEINKSNK